MQAERTHRTALTCDIKIKPHFPNTTKLLISQNASPLPDEPQQNRRKSFSTLSHQHALTDSANLRPNH